MQIDCEPEEDGEGEDAEPSLGSFDRMTDQSKSWRQAGLWACPEIDAEVDDCDREEGAPNEAKQQLGAAVHEISMMVLVLLDAVEVLQGADTSPKAFQMPYEAGEILSFAAFDLDKRLKVLRDRLACA